MTKPRKKSAKDLAFDKERAAFRKAIRESEHEKKDILIQNRQLKDQINTLQNELSEKQKVIDMLMETQKLSPENLQKLLQNAEFKQQLMGIFGVMSNVTKHM